MDSINRQQPEENHKDLQASQAIKKIKEIAGKNNTCFFSTCIRTEKLMATRPMAVQKIDDEGNFWFLSANDSYKNLQIQQDGRVQLLFQGSAYSDFLSISGEATISTDKELIKELWNPMLKTWFTEGIDDPRISVIKVETIEGYYWDNKHGNAVALLKTAIGAAIGQTLDDSIEGKLKV
jgi:general stress protein 26